jgi:hypothetical protein
VGDGPSHHIWKRLLTEADHSATRLPAFTLLRHEPGSTERRSVSESFYDLGGAKIAD